MTLRDPIARLADELSPEVRSRRLALYVALGDSFSEGTGCAPGQAWPERLATALRAANPSLELRNLAAHGATSDQVLAQAGEAVELEPDLVTVVCGANDVLLTPRPDVAAYSRRLAGVFGRLRQAVPGVRIVTATAPERWEFLELRPRTRERVERGIARLNRATRTVAAAYDVPCLDVAGHPGLSEPANFSADGLHPSPLGHERAAHGFAELLRERCAIEITTEGGADADADL